MRDAIGHGARLAAASPGQHQHGSLGMLGDQTLLAIQLVKKMCHSALRDCCSLGLPLDDCGLNPKRTTDSSAIPGRRSYFYFTRSPCVLILGGHDRVMTSFDGVNKLLPSAVICSRAEIIGLHNLW